MNKKWKIIIIVSGVILLAGGVRLAVFLHNVNRDMDNYYYRIIALEKQVVQLRTNQASMISSRDTQRLLDQQAAAYQEQLNLVNGQIQYMNDQANRANADYQMQELNKANNPFERRY
jgi:hypothetical protein